MCQIEAHTLMARQHMPVAGAGRYLLGVPEAEAVGLLVASHDEPGVLHRVTETILRHGANITYVAGGSHKEGAADLQLEVTGAADTDRLVADLSALEGVTKVSLVPTFQNIYGKRVIVIGGGAQVGMVAQGAVSEADRHNIRGERISVDTIPLVGEEQLAAAVRAVARLHRARVLVLAGALMGGDITKAVREIRDAGILVVCTNMAGSVPEAADLVVSDPVEAGVMSVMLIADTASFSIEHVRGRRF
jgi:energy-converting hydrogenase B subunit Q